MFIEFFNFHSTQTVRINISRDMLESIYAESLKFHVVEVDEKLIEIPLFFWQTPVRSIVSVEATKSLE